MAMSELKQKLLLYELAKIGYPDAVYMPKYDEIKVQPDNDSMPLINDGGNITFKSEYRDFVFDTLKPIVDKVNEVAAAWEKSQPMPFENLSPYRVLAEYNNVMLAARDNTENGRGLYFVTWQYDYERTGVDHGHYTDDYTAAKEDFSKRSGLVSTEKLLTQEQASEIIAAVEYRIENDGDLPYERGNLLNTVAEQITSAYLGKNPDSRAEINAETHEPQAETSPKANAINGEISVGDWVIAAGNSNYSYLVGEVTSIVKYGTPEHDTGSLTDDIHVNFANDDYPELRRAEIVNEFGWAYTEPKSYDELPLSDVIVSPQTLIRIMELDRNEYYKLVDSRDNAEAFCNRFQGGNEHEGDKHSELMERLNKNLSDYHNMLDGFGNRELIEMADKISAMTNAHLYMTGYDFDNEELDFYLQFQNPLEVIADAYCQRNADIEDVSFVMDGIYDRQDALVEYPLMSDIDPLQDEILRRYMDIDLELYLGIIAEKVITRHPDDWEIDKETLRKAAVSDNPEEKRLMWHVCGYGTHLNTERDTFIRDTDAFTTWVDYRPRDDDMFGYVVEVTGSDSNGTIKGNVFEVGDYYLHSLYVRETANVLDSVSLTYSGDWGVNAGKTITVPRYEYKDDRNRLMNESGNVVSIQYHPAESVKIMSELLRNERAKRMALPIGSTSELLRKMADKLSEVRTPPETAEKTAVQKTVAQKPKPKTLDEKMAAAKEKVKTQDENNGSNKTNTRKTGERE